MTPKERRAALRAIKQAATLVEHAANALKPHEDVLDVADLRAGWLDDAHALARLYGTLAIEPHRKEQG